MTYFVQCGNKALRCLLAYLVLLVVIPGAAHGESGTVAADRYSGYYSREQNDGEIAKASRKSHYIRFYPENRIVRLFIPFPYSRTLSRGVIGQTFEHAINSTTGSAFIQGTFGVLEQRAVANVDFVKKINGAVMFDCDKSAPCRIEFVESGMRVIQKGLVTDHVIAYDYVSDP